MTRTINKRIPLLMFIHILNFLILKVLGIFIIYYNNLHFITVEKSNCQTLPLLTTQLEILYQKLN